MNKREILLEVLPDEEFLTADGFDDAIIGYCDSSYRVIYSVAKCIEILMQGGMDRAEAEEYFYFNTAQAYVGEKTPIWCNDVEIQIYSDL